MFLIKDSTSFKNTIFYSLKSLTANNLAVNFEQVLSNPFHISIKLIIFDKNKF